MSSEFFILPRRVAYHETDAMGVVHHTNYIKYFEEARVEWLRARNLIKHHEPYGPYIFAVTQQEAKYTKPAGFDEPLEVYVQARVERVRIYFQYAVKSKKSDAWLAHGSTTLVAIDKSMQPVRLPPEVLEVFKKESWSQEWPPA